MLQKNGYNVMVAVDGQDALKQSRDFAGTVHLLISDVEMPNMPVSNSPHSFKLTGPPCGFC
jgi:CheY-like chemotaxis protein